VATSRLSYSASGAIYSCHPAPVNSPPGGVPGAAIAGQAHEIPHFEVYSFKNSYLQTAWDFLKRSADTPIPVAAVIIWRAKEQFPLLAAYTAWFGAAAPTRWPHLALASWFAQLA